MEYAGSPTAPTPRPPLVQTLNRCGRADDPELHRLGLAVERPNALGEAASRRPATLAWRSAMRQDGAVDHQTQKERFWHVPKHRRPQS